jgi:hypothetical protein
MIEFSEIDLITTDSYLQIAKKKPDRVSYIKTDYLRNGNVQFEWRGEIHPSSIRRISIMGHSDHHVEDSDCENFDLIFCVNKNTTNPKVYGLPLGLPNDCNDLPILGVYGDKKMVIDISKEERIKKNLAYINFSKSTFPEERGKILQEFSSEEWVHIGIPDSTSEGRKKYLRDLKESKFCFCPRGNGIDTHRFWESLYMGCYPIAKYYPAHDFCYDLPVLFVDEWDEINQELLDRKWEEFSLRDWNYEKLKISYWEIFINDKMMKIK